MVTMEKLSIYIRYKGDLDMWTRIGGAKERQIINSDDWYLIDSLLQDVEIINNGNASDQFLEELYQRLLQNCDGEVTIAKIKSLRYRN